MPPYLSSCDGVRGEIGATTGAYGQGEHPQYEGLYVENGSQWVCAPC